MSILVQQAQNLQRYQAANDFTRSISKNQLNIYDLEFEELKRMYNILSEALDTV